MFLFLAKLPGSCLLLLARWIHRFNIIIWIGGYLDKSNKRDKINEDKQYLIWNRPETIFYQQIHQNCTTTVQHLRRGTYCIIMYLVKDQKSNNQGKRKSGDEWMMIRLFTESCTRLFWILSKIWNIESSIRRSLGFSVRWPVS